MKVLHLVVDGWDPSIAIGEGPCSLMTESEIYDDLYRNFKFHFSRSKEFPFVDHLRSNFEWARIYSGEEYNYYRPSFDIQDDPYNSQNYNDKIAHNTDYNLIPKESWMWNKLSLFGVTNYWFPYFKVSEMLRKGKVSDTVFSNSTYMYLAQYGKTLKTEISKKERHRDSDNTVFTYPDMCVGFADIRRTDKEALELWERIKNTDKEEDSKILKNTQDLINFLDTRIYPKFKECCDSVFKIYTRFLNLIKSKGYGSHNLDFVHIGTAELDAFYHYSSPSQKLKGLGKEFYQKLIRTILAELDPDIVIMTGDHGFTLCNNEVVEYDIGQKDALTKYSGYFIEDGDLRFTQKAVFSHLPYSKMHSCTQGYTIFSKDERLFERIISFYLPMRLLKKTTASDEIYNLLINKEFWDELDEWEGVKE